MLKPSLPGTLRWLLLACGLLLSTTNATPPASKLDLFDLGAPSFTTYSIHDGLPASIMAGVHVDRQGFVWASSAERLARFDGNRWLTDAPISTQGALGSLMTTHDGTLWAAFRDRGIARFDGVRWHVVTNFPARTVRRLVETTDSKGQYVFWALTFDQGLLQQVGSRWLPAPQANQLPGPLISMAVTHDLLGQRRQWLGTGSAGLWYRQDNRPWRRFEAPGFNATQIEDLLVSHGGGREQLWISTFGFGLWRLDADGLHAWTVRSGDVPSDSFYSLAQSRLASGDYAIWAASRGGLVRVHGDQARAFGRRYGLSSDVVRDLGVWRSPDGMQILWLATEGGMARASAGVTPWQIVSLMGAQATGVFAVLVEPAGNSERIWVGSADDGLGRYERGQWQRFGKRDGLPADSISTIKRTPDANGADTLWIGFSGGGLVRVLDGPRFVAEPGPWEMTNTQGITDILGGAFAHGHELWVATRTSGLYRRHDGAWSPMQPPGAPEDWHATSLVRQLDAKGRAWLWATSSLGLLRYDGHRVSVALSITATAKPDLIDMALFEDGKRSVLWIGTSDGITRVDVTDPMQPRVLPDDLPAPPDPVAYGVLRDSQGRIYICTNNGVQQLTPTRHGYASRVFTRRDGMPHDECNTNAQFIDAHDRYWAGTLGGLGVYDAANELRDTQPKPLTITGAWLDDTSTSTDTVVIQPGQRYLRVQYALLSWLHNDKSVFRSQLVGDESAPTPWTHHNERSFDHLPPGRYTLRIEARDYAGNLSTPARLAITVLPAWWQTAAARIAFGLCALALFYLFLHWRLRSMRGQRQQLEAQVSARTHELNAANALLLELSYHDALTGLANRRKLHAALEDAAARGDRRAWSLIFVDVDHFKAYNDHFGHPAGDEALRAVATAMQACAPADALVARYGGEEFACLLPATHPTPAARVAECMRQRVEAEPIPVPGEETLNRVTISVGIAERMLDSATDFHRLLRDADAALYAAKSAGRNCIRVNRGQRKPGSE